MTSDPDTSPASAQAVIDLMRHVRQTRDFRPDPVPDAALRQILEAARWTGSVGNRQPWTLIVVTDAETRRHMADAATNTPHIGIAPAVIVAAMEPRGVEVDNFDEGRLAERMMVAAAALGLSSGIGRAGREAGLKIAQLLGVPEDRTVRTMVSVGYPTEAGARPKVEPGTARKPLDEIVRRERFS
jgi:nitroreductase